MAKRLAVKVEQYQNEQGENKGRYVDLGVILDGDNGQYLLIDPTVSLAGCLSKQNIMNHQAGKKVRISLMVSIFDDDNQNQGQNNPPDHLEQPF